MKRCPSSGAQHFCVISVFTLCESVSRCVCVKGMEMAFAIMDFIKAMQDNEGQSLAFAFALAQMLCVDANSKYAMRNK